jgi:hypothetical protein
MTQCDRRVLISCISALAYLPDWGSSQPSDRGCAWRADSGIRLGYLAVSFW